MLIRSLGDVLVTPVGVREDTVFRMVYACERPGS